MKILDWIATKLDYVRGDRYDELQDQYDEVIDGFNRVHGELGALESFARKLGLTTVHTDENEKGETYAIAVELGEYDINVATFLMMRDIDVTMPMPKDPPKGGVDRPKTYDQSIFSGQDAAAYEKLSEREAAAIDMTSLRNSMVKATEERVARDAEREANMVDHPHGQPLPTDVLPAREDPERKVPYETKAEMEQALQRPPADTGDGTIADTEAWVKHYNKPRAVKDIPQA